MREYTNGSTNFAEWKFSVARSSDTSLCWLSRQVESKWILKGPTRKKKGENKKLKKMFNVIKNSCDPSQRNPFTKNFSDYLHVYLSLFLIFWSPISSVSVLSAHLWICGPSYLCSCRITLASVPFCSRYTTCISSLTLFFCCPVGWSCRIHQLLLSRGVRPTQRVSWIWH